MPLHSSLSKTISKKKKVKYGIKSSEVFFLRKNKFIFSFNFGDMQLKTFIWFLIIYETLWLGTVAHACNLSTLGG